MFGEYLKAFRERAGISQEALAEEAEISSAYVSQMESGQRNPPSPSILRHMAGPLGIPYPVLLYAAGYLRDEELQALILRILDELFQYGSGRDRLDRRLREILDRWMRFDAEERERRLALTDADHIAELLVEELLNQERRLILEALLAHVPMNSYQPESGPPDKGGELHSSTP